MKIFEINLFVYDNMMSGRSNSHLLNDALLLGSATLQGFDTYDMGSFISVLPGESTIHGEIYRVNSKLLKEIDRFQGYGKLYRRITTNYVPLSGELMQVDVYTLMDRCMARDNRKM